MSTPLERLRHHVSGAIERGEAVAIIGVPAVQAPKYRADVKGSLAVTKRECTDMFRSEMNQSDVFCLTPDCCESTMREYSDYLTAAELTACFKKALQS